MTFKTITPSLVSKNIMQYIADKRGYLATSPWYILHLGSLTKSNNHRETNRHSVGIEMVDFNITNAECLAMKRREKRRCEGQLKAARNWSLQHYAEPLTAEYVEGVGRVVDPEINKAGFRTDSVRVSGSRVSPPGEEKLHRELGIMLLENEALENPLERAIHAHLNLARVHPFDDGNGRTARLIQDAVLYHNQFPIPTIDLSERGEYMQKMEKAIYTTHVKEAEFDPTTSEKLEELRKIASMTASSPEERKRGLALAKELMYLKITPEQNYFYDFIALKVLDGLTREMKRVFPSERELAAHFKKLGRE